MDCPWTCLYCPSFVHQSFGLLSWYAWLPPGQVSISAHLLLKETAQSLFLSRVLRAEQWSFKGHGGHSRHHDRLLWWRRIWGDSAGDDRIARSFQKGDVEGCGWQGCGLPSLGPLCSNCLLARLGAIRHQSLSTPPCSSWERHPGCVN